MRRVLNFELIIVRYALRLEKDQMISPRKKIREGREGMSSATHMQRLMLSMLKKSVQQKIQWLPVRYQLPIHSVCSLKQGIDICNCL